MNGGDYRPVIVPGKAVESEPIPRITSNPGPSSWRGRGASIGRSESVPQVA